MSLQWAVDPLRVPVPVNQFLIQGLPGPEGTSLPDGFAITLGSLVPPFVAPGMSPEQLRDFGANNVATVVPVGQFAFSIDRLREFRDHLSNVLRAVGVDE